MCNLYTPIHYAISLKYLRHDFLVIFNSWVCTSVPRVFAGTGICKWATRSLVVDAFVINRVRTREREDLSFPKKHALTEVRWHQFLAESVHRALQHSQRIEVLPNLRHAGIFQISTIQESLTRKWAFALLLLQLKRWLDFIPSSNVVGYVSSCINNHHWFSKLRTEFRD